MKAMDVIRRLHEHRIWVNHSLAASVLRVQTEDLHRPLAIGQGSIWKTLTHMLAAEYVWLETLLGDESPCMPGDVPGRLPGNQAGEPAIASLDELISKWSTLNERWIDYLSKLSDDALDEVVYKVSTSSGSGTRHPSKRADVLMHVCTHAQYTTAQLVNMLRQVGESRLPDVMLITLARQEARGDLGESARTASN